MKHVLFVIALVAMVFCIAGSSLAQDQSAPDKLVKLFKDNINKSKSTDLKKLLMDIDDPDVVLLTSNYDRMEDAMQTYIAAWKDKPFQIYNTVKKDGNSGVVYMWSPATMNQIKFYVVRLRVGKDWKWFIRDTEIFENAQYAGDEGEIIE